MPTPDHNSRNGFSPRPGTVHRPTRTSLIPSEGPSPVPGADYGQVHGPRVNHWTDDHISQAVRIPTTGEQVPNLCELIPNVQERVTVALTNHGHMSPNERGGPNVTDVDSDGNVTINPNVGPRVTDCINRLVIRVRGTDTPA